MSFLRTEQEGDPSAVQGARERVAHQEISLGPPVRSDSSSSEEEEEEESEEGSEGTESEPGQRVLVGRSPLTQLMSASSSPRGQQTFSSFGYVAAYPPYIITIGIITVSIVTVSVIITVTDWLCRHRGHSFLFY